MQRDSLAEHPLAVPLLLLGPIAVLVVVMLAIRGAPPLLALVVGEGVLVPAFIAGLAGMRALDRWRGTRVTPSGITRAGVLQAQALICLFAPSTTDIGWPAYALSWSLAACCVWLALRLRAR